MQTLEDIAKIERQKHPERLSIFIYRPVCGGFDVTIEISDLHWKGVPAKHVDTLDEALQVVGKLVREHFG
jgi:hypothetical protein